MIRSLNIQNKLNKIKKIKWWHRALFVLFLFGWAAFAVVRILSINPFDEPTIQANEVVFESSDQRETRFITHIIKRGETLDKVLKDAGLKNGDAYRLINGFKKVWDVRKCNIDDIVDFEFDPSGKLVSFTYESSPAVVFDAISDNGEYLFSKREIPFSREVIQKNVELTSSLYNAFLKVGEEPMLIEKIVDVLAWDVDFHSDPRKGDTVSLLFEKYFIDGEFYKYGQILMINYDGRIVQQKAAYYQHANGKGAYYDEKGLSLARNFLKTPVKFTRISSRYGRRRHPVTHRLKAHLGTDYAAPTGSPVWAMGSGTIIKKGYGRANGKYIAIRHKKGLETYYLHLSRFHPGIKVGKRVRQKDLIGYVGSTGLSTGPHLHLGMKRGGKFINPLRIKKVKETKLAGDNLERLQRQYQTYYVQLSGEIDDVLTSLPDPLDNLQN